MQKIDTLYVANHSHTDIGFTDYQDVCFRQHAEFIDAALDLIEATADYPEEARYRWVCEVTGPLERYLRRASSAQRARFRYWHTRGYIDVAGMQYNLTPLLDTEELQRSLYPVRRLREEYGLSVTTAMQCDVNGISWLFADLLPAVGIDFLTLAVNTFRGGAPKPRPAAFWWESRAGAKLLTWNGYHYLFGRSMVALGDWRFADRFLPPLIQRLEEDPAYPFAFLYGQATHPVRVDNGPPDRRLPDFVREWNAAGRTPRLVITTPSAFGRHLRETHGADLPTLRGDWLDWWCDGVASSAYETGVNRTTHALLQVTETLGAWLRALGHDHWDADHLRRIFELTTLYDEHTWGAFSSIDAPTSLFTRAQWNRKASYAFAAAAETHDVLARTARAFGALHGNLAGEGVFNLGALASEEAYPFSGAAELLVINTLPWPRTVLVEEPEQRGGTAPAGMLEQFFPRDVPWGGNRPVTPLRRVRGEVPALGFAFLPLASAAPAADLHAEPGMIENAHYRIRVDPATGALAEWFDKDLAYNFAGTYRGWGLGQYVYESVDSPLGRGALFAGDFSHPDFGVWGATPPFHSTTATEVWVQPPTIQEGRASLSVEITAPGIRRARCTFSLDSGAKTLAVDWVLEKRHVTDPESVFIAFPCNLGRPAFRADVNGLVCTPGADQLPGTVHTWYPVQGWVDVSDGQRGVTLAPLDAPLLHLGGITTARWTPAFEAEGPTIMSWALNNHWMVNFKASQGGEIPLRYRLTTHAGPCEDHAAIRFGAEAATPTLVLRDYLRTGDPSGTLLAPQSDAAILLGAKPAEDGDGLILRLQEVQGIDQILPVESGVDIVAACLTSPLEEDGAPLTVDGRSVHIPIHAHALQSVRFRFSSRR
jgi:alpha-mannosidase